MNLRYEIYETPREGFLEYSFSSEGYQGPIGQVYRRYLKGIMFIFNIDPLYHGYGIGRAAFNRAYERMNKGKKVQFIEGNWMKSKKFKHLENGCCINFNIYKKGKIAGLTSQEAALATPTGKWSAELGFNKVAIIKENSRRVEVRFYRSVTAAPSYISFGIETYLNC